MQNHDRAIDACRQLCCKFTDDEAYIEQEIRRSGANVLVFSLTIEHITGKLVNES